MLQILEPHFAVDILKPAAIRHPNSVQNLIKSQTASDHVTKYVSYHARSNIALRILNVTKSAIILIELQTVNQLLQVRNQNHFM